MHAPVGAARVAQPLTGAVGEHLVDVHVMRRPGPRLVDVHDELVAQPARQHLIRGGDDGGRDIACQPPEGHIRLGRAFLDEHGGRHQIGGHAQPADGKVLDRPDGLDAVIGLGRNRLLAQRVALDAEGHGVATPTANRQSCQSQSQSSIYNFPMIPAFFDSVLDLIVKTSTELPPDVRAAMRVAMDGEPEGTRSAQALKIIATNIDLAANNEGAICQDTGMPTFEVTGAGGRQPDLDEAAGAPGRRRGNPPRQAAPQLGRFHHRRELRRQPRPRHANRPLPSVGAGRRDRGEADSEGRRLREHERPVLAAGGTAASGTRRPQPGRRAQVHSPRRVAGAGQGLRARSRRRLHRRRPDVGLHRGEAAAVPHAGRRERRRAAGRTGSRRDAHREHARRRHDGLRRRRLAHRLQGRRAQPAARELLRVGRVRLLGVQAAWRGARRANGRDQAVALSRPGLTGDPDDRPGRLPANRPRSPADARPWTRRPSDR